MTNNIVDISYKLRKNMLFLIMGAVFPNCVQTTEELADSEDLEMKLDDQFEFDVFGSDVWGGFAYFGKTEEILILQEKINHYLYNCVGNAKYGQFYARWDFENGYSTILLYEDFADTPENPLPSAENVFRTEFGAWTNDDVLPEVLDTVEDWDETVLNVGGEKFNIDNKVHSKLLEEFKKALVTTYPKFYN